MKIKALKSIIQFDAGQMVVINAGETGELSESLALQQIAADCAEEVAEGTPQAEDKPKVKARGRAATKASAEDAPQADGDEDGPPA